MIIINTERYFSMTDKLPTTLPAFFWHFIKKQPWQFIVLFVSTIANLFEYNIAPYALKLMVDTVVRLGNETAHAYSILAVPLGLFLGAWAVMFIIWRAQEWVYTSAIPQFRANICMGLFRYVQAHSYAYFGDYFAGSIAGKIGDMPRAAANLVELTRWRLLAAWWVVVAAILWLGTISIYFSLMLVVWVTVHIGLSYLFARRVAFHSAQHAEDLNVLQGHIVDVLTNSATMRLFARRPYEGNYIGKWQSIEKASAQQTARTMWKSRLATDIPLLLMYAVALFGLVEGWKAGWVTAGDIVFVMFTVYNVMALTWMLGAELPNFFSEIGVCKQALTLITKPHDIVDAPGATPLHLTHGEIVFDNVHFHYMPGRDIFRDKSIVIRGGEKVGLVGFSGSGKSTFVNLILRLYDVESGRIVIDGQDIAKVTQDSLREAISMIPQDTTLFHRTLMENIRYGKPEATDDEVIAASKQAHCHEFVMQTEQGYNSLVGERGVKLSGGQRQRIAIARAILKNAPILILDEATSSLDSVTEKYIQKSLAELMRDRTTIVVAHRLSTLAHLDRILVFKDGEIIEDGSHAALLEAAGHYATLWNMQAGGFLPESIEQE